MLIREKSKQDRPDAPAENLTMVSAIFGAVADFAEPAEEKLKAVIRAGQIAEAFLAGANARFYSPHRTQIATPCGNQFYRYLRRLLTQYRQWQKLVSRCLQGATRRLERSLLRNMMSCIFCTSSLM
jgi:enoyl-CoA hydratase/carnithine racemase